MAAVSIHSHFGAQEHKLCHCFHCFPISLLWSGWTKMPWSLFFECWVFKQLFHSPLSPSSRGSLVPLTFCHNSGIIWIFEVIDVSPGNLDFNLWVIQLAFHMMYSAYKLNKQGDNIQPWRTSFPIWNQSIVSCKVLTVLPDLHASFSGGR